MNPNGGYRLIPQDNGLLSAHQYSQKLIDSLLQTELEPDFILKSFTKIIEKIHAEPTRVRQLTDIVSRLVYIISHQQHTQAILNQELVNFLRGHQHRMKMFTE